MVNETKPTDPLDMATIIAWLQPYRDVLVANIFASKPLFGYLALPSKPLNRRQRLRRKVRRWWYDYRPRLVFGDDWVKDEW